MRHRWSLFLLLESKRYFRNMHTFLVPLVVTLWIIIVSGSALVHVTHAPSLMYTGYATLWLCSGLCFLLGADKLFQVDYHSGLLEQVLLAPSYFILLLRILLFAVFYAVFFCVICLPILWGLLNIPNGNLFLFIACLLLGLPALCMAMALGASINLTFGGGGFVQALIAFPLYIPNILLSMLALTGDNPSFYLITLLICSLVSLSVIPFAIEYILRNAVTS